MSNSFDITGLRSGKLVALAESHKDGRHWLWECKCDCGQTALFPNRYLRNELVSNCGKCASSTRKNAVYLGETSVNTEGYTAEVVGFVSTSPSIFKVKFKDSKQAIVNVAAGNFKKGNFCNPYHVSVAGVGYYGVGPFVAKVDGKHTKEYEDWNSMLKRCYVVGEDCYKDKGVFEDWKCFQDFAHWATKQPNFGRDGWDLEKDLLSKGNNQYAPDKCVYVPREINSFIKRKRMNDLPLGVDIAYKYNGTPYFRVQSREDGKNICLGGFSSVEEAFNTYKTHKEYLAKKLATKWKSEIPDIAYKALLNYNVELTD